MKAQMNNIPNIKIGLLRSGRLINEVVVDELHDVFVGTALDNTIVVNVDGFYTTFPLLQYGQDRYYLNIPDGMTGKVFQGEKVVSVEGMKDHPDAVSRDGITTIPLSDDVRGILFFDKHTLLFKIYPFEPTPKKLSKKYRGGIFTSDFDFTFFTILSILLVAYVVLVYSFNSVVPKNGDADFEKIPERFARLIMDRPDLPKEQVKELKKNRSSEIKQIKQVSKADKQDNVKNKMLRNKGVTIASKGKTGGGVEAKKSSSEVVRSSGIIGIIGSKGRGGTVANLFQESGFGDKLNKALKGVAGLRAGSSIDEAKMKRGSGDAKGVDIGSLKTTTGSGLVAFGSGQDSGAVNILGGIGEGDVEGAGSMSPAVIAKTLSQHISAFQYCYNKALKTNPRLSGELKVKFIILTSGDVSKNNMSFNGSAARDANLTSCVQRVFTRIRFPSPKGGEVIVNYPLNFTAQN